MDSLARLVGMPVDTFIKAFRQAFHTTPYQFLLDRRIEQAKTLLVTTSVDDRNRLCGGLSEPESLCRHVRTSCRSVASRLPPVSAIDPDTGPNPAFTSPYAFPSH